MDIVQMLYDFGQEHLLVDLSNLEPSEKTELIVQLNKPELERMKRAMVDTSRISFHPTGSLSENISRDLRTQLRKEGFELIAKGQVAVIMIAETVIPDGQPVATLEYSSVSLKSLFQIFAERIQRLTQLVSEAAKKKVNPIPWVIVSTLNLNLQDFFEENGYFEMPDSIFIVENTVKLPVVDTANKIVLENKNSVKKESIGSGGIYPCLNSSGAIKWLAERKVKFVHLCKDNDPLLKICDPVFLGYAQNADVEILNKIIQRKEDDGLRLIAKNDLGALSIVEPSDLDDKTNYEYASIENHIIKLEFFKRIHEDNIRYRIQEIPGNLKAIKSVYFDMFYFSTSTAVFEAKITESSIVTCESTLNLSRNCLSSMHSDWLTAAGAFVKNKQDRGGFSEISSLVSYEGEGLESFAHANIQAPFYIFY